MFERLDLIRSRDVSPASGSVVDTLQAALLLIRTAPATITAPLVRAIDSQGALHSLRVLGRPTVTDLMIGYLAAQAQTIRLWCGDLPDEGGVHGPDAASILGAKPARRLRDRNVAVH